MKGRTREKERKRLFDRAREREGHKGTRAVSKTRKRERKRRRRRFRFRPSGNRTRSPPFLVFDPRQILLPTFPFPLSYVLLRALLLHLVGPYEGLSSVRLPSRHPYAKCIYVLCKASNRRWPREPDAQCVINTDALVVSFPPSSPPVPLLIRLLRACPVSAGPAAQAKRTARLGEYQINASTVTVGR